MNEHRTGRITRRTAITGGISAMVTVAFGQANAGTQCAAGIQLYTVREAMAENVMKTLKRVAAIGYRQVEFAGYFDIEPATIRQMLDDLGLGAPSAHVHSRLIRDDPKPLIEAAQLVGHRYLVLDWLFPEDRESADDYRRWADISNQFGEQCRDAGLAFAWHNHDYEFVRNGDAIPFDLLLGRTDPALVTFELDFYWATLAGEDPIAILGKAPHRFPLCHVKDMSPDRRMSDVGAGQIDFTRILSHGNSSEIRYCFVERDDAPRPFETAKRSYSAFAKVLDDIGCDQATR